MVCNSITIRDQTKDQYDNYDYLACYQGSNGDNREVNRLKKGQYFGELGLISKKPRAASVFAVGQVRCAGMETIRLLLDLCDISILSQAQMGYVMSRLKQDVYKFQFWGWED